MRLLPLDFDNFDGKLATVLLSKLRTVRQTALDMLQRYMVIMCWYCYWYTVQWYSGTGSDTSMLMQPVASFDGKPGQVAPRLLHCCDSSSDARIVSSFEIIVLDVVVT